MEEDDQALKALKYVPWFNKNAQLAFFINIKYWMEGSKVLIRPNAARNGFEIILVGRDTNWKTNCIVFITFPPTVE